MSLVFTADSPKAKPKMMADVFKASQIAPIEPLEVVKRSNFVLTPERRLEILTNMRKAIPGFAKARREIIAKNCVFARLCILDAFQGRLSNGLATNSKKSKLMYTVFQVQTSELLFKSVLTACCLHTLAIFFEPENACSSSVFVKMFQIGVVLIYLVDISLKMSYEGIEEYFGHDWQQLYVIVTALNIIDLTVNGCTSWTNPLRPVIGVLRARNGRRFFEVLKKMIPGMSHSLVPIFFFIVLIMVSSSLVFDDRVQDFMDPYYVSYNWFFLIFTNDNFGRMLPDQMFKHLSYLCFFFPAIYVGQKFLLSLIIGDTYDTFRSFVKKQVKKEKLKEMQGLVKAFTQLDDLKQGIIAPSVWRKCIHTFNPEISNEAIALYYELLSGGNKEGITVLQFLSLRSVLAFKLTTTTSHPNMFQKIYNKTQIALSAAYKKLHLPTLPSMHGPCAALLKLFEKHQLSAKLNYFDVFILSFSLADTQLFPVYLPWLTPCAIVSMAMLFEYYLRVAANKGAIYEMGLDTSIMSWLFTIGSTGLIALLVIAYVKHIHLDTIVSIPFTVYAVPYRKILLVLRGCRCMRMANINSDLKNFSSAVMDIIPALFETFTFTFIITYIFGCAGNLLFGHKMEEWGTPLRAVVKAQELTFMVNFLDSIEDAMEKTHPTSVIFFICYLILSLTVSNIALSIIIDLHANVLDSHSNKEREGQKGKIDLVFEKIVSQARTRTIFNSELGNLNFKNVTMSQFQSSSVRHFVADAEGSVLKIEDVKACAKHSNIDLVKHYLEHHRNHKDVNWEVDFIAAVEDAGIGTEVTYQYKDEIFKHDTPATHLYLITAGSVLVYKAFEERTVVHHVNFMGTEALQPGGMYQVSCVAEKETKCLVISQEELSHKLDEELCGSIVRMAFKSHAMMETSFAKAKRKTPRNGAYARGYSPSLVGGGSTDPSPRLNRSGSSDWLHQPTPGNTPSPPSSASKTVAFNSEGNESSNLDTANEKKNGTVASATTGTEKVEKAEKKKDQ